MKLIAAGVTHSAASVRSPSFSRSSSSTTSTISPRRIRRNASSIYVRDTSPSLFGLSCRGSEHGRRRRRLLVDRYLDAARNGHHHAATMWLAALDMDVAAVQVDDPAGDGEPEPRTAFVGRARGIGAIEALEHVNRVGRRDAGALIDNFEPGAVALRNGTNGDDAVEGRMPNRVLDEIGNDLVQPLRVRLEREAFGLHVDVEPNADVPELRLPHGVAEHRLDLEQPAVERHGARLE